MRNVGRPKLQIARTRVVTIRVTDFEFEKISKIAQKKIFQKPKQFCAEFFFANLRKNFVAS